MQKSIGVKKIKIKIIIVIKKVIMCSQCEGEEQHSKQP